MEFRCDPTCKKNDHGQLSRSISEETEVRQRVREVHVYVSSCVCDICMPLVKNWPQEGRWDEINTQLLCAMYLAVEYSDQKIIALRTLSSVVFLRGYKHLTFKEFKYEGLIEDELIIVMSYVCLILEGGCAPPHHFQSAGGGVILYLLSVRFQRFHFLGGRGNLQNHPILCMQYFA